MLRAVPGALQREAITAGVAFLSLVNQLLEHWKVGHLSEPCFSLDVEPMHLAEHLYAWSAGWPAYRLV